MNKTYISRDSYLNSMPPVSKIEPFDYVEARKIYADDPLALAIIERMELIEARRWR